MRTSRVVAFTSIGAASTMPDSDPDVEAKLAQAMESPQPEGAEAETSGPEGVFHWLRHRIAAEVPFLPSSVPPPVEEAFHRIFERVRQTLGAREEDFVLGNVSLRRESQGVRLAYRWREDSEETASCSCGGKTLTVTRDEHALGEARHVIRKHIHVDRDGTKISASDDRENHQLREADCQAALEVFEVACRVVAPDEVDSPNDEASPSEEA